jgi:hypothetical protein
MPNCSQWQQQVTYAEEAWMAEAAKGPKELVVIDSAINDPKRMGRSNSQPRIPEKRG